VVDCQKPEDVESGKKGSSAVLIVPDPSSSKCISGGSYEGLCLEYGKSYYWRVRVKAATGNLNWSDWQPGPLITTEDHAYPWVDFTWTPETPSAGDIVQFSDTSIAYGDGEARIKKREWTFSDGDPSTLENIQNPTTTFTSAGPKTVKLTVTDSDDFSCPKEKTINIQMPSGEWQEVPP
jgi:PKD repeat protein